MRKAVRFVSAVLLVVMVFGLTSCQKNRLKGSWKCDKFFDRYDEMNELERDFYRITFNADWTYSKERLKGTDQTVDIEKGVYQYSEEDNFLYLYPNVESVDDIKMRHYKQYRINFLYDSRIAISNMELPTSTFVHLDKKD